MQNKIFITHVCLLIFFLEFPSKANLACKSLLKNNSVNFSFDENDLLIGREGRSISIAYKGITNGILSEQTYSREEVFIVDDVLRAEEAQKNNEFIHAVSPLTGKSVALAPETFIFPGSELSLWSSLTTAKSYQDWDFISEMPIYTRVQLIKEFYLRSEIYQREIFSVINPNVYKHLFKRFLLKKVANGSKIHINIAPSDFHFIQNLSSLNEEERRYKVAKLRQDFFDGLYRYPGSLTRLELIVILSNRKLFAASLFYKNYSEPLPREVVETFWIGDELLRLPL